MVSSHSDTFSPIRATASLSPPRTTGVSPPSPAVSHQSTFKNALKHIPVPSPLIVDGIPVLRVYANGKTQKCYLTLSEDKFTLYVSLDSPNKKRRNRSRGFWFSSPKSNANQPSFKASTPFTSGGQQPTERAIDIGSIHRIQRGHSTQRFALARKHRQDSLKSLRSDNSRTSNKPSNVSAATLDALSDTTSIMSSSAAASTRSSSSIAAAALDDDGNLFLDPSQCFSIIFRGDWTLDLMLLSASAASGGASRDEILDALDMILKTYQKKKENVSNDVLLLRYVWMDADRDKSNSITANELGRVLDRINYQMKKSQLHDLYEQFGKIIGLDRRMRRQGLTFEQTCTLLHKIKRDSWQVKPVNTYWNSIFGEFMKNGKPRATVSDKTFLEKFLHKRQGETHMTLKDVHRLFEKLNDFELPHVAGDQNMVTGDNTRIDKNRFEAYLLGEDNDAYDPKKEAFSIKSMGRPISEYWVNSSHNTYLTGDQFTSHSSVDMYSHALYRGCRCLELDIWDGDTGIDGLPVPVVWHGHTMTSKIVFQDIIKAIKLYLNFHPDTYPLILSFENHCSIPYQEIMASQLVTILGKLLYIPNEANLLGRLPSPNELRGLVVIKGRRPDNLDLDAYESDDDMSDDGAPSTVYSGDVQVTPPAMQQHQPQVKKVKHGVSPALARLTLFHGTKLKNWDDSVMIPTHHMHSFSETKVRHLTRKTDRLKWAVYNQSHMSRTYPAGSRVDSSNYLPILPWSVGCQLVALNFQTNDAALRLNDGRFRENGGCGYVLKPGSMMEQLLEQQHPSSPTSPSRLAAPPPVKLSIRILSGSCLPKPKEQKTGECIDPYVKVSVYDVKNGDRDAVTTFQTSVAYKNGFFPIWNDHKFTFTIENWPVAMLQLSVFDKDVATTDNFLASASIPLTCLRKGLRSVKLFDATNKRSGAFDFSSLLIEVKMVRGEAELVAEF